LHLVGFTIEIYSDARSYKRQMRMNDLCDGPFLSILLVFIKFILGLSYSKIRHTHTHTHTYDTVSKLLLGWPRYRVRFQVMVVYFSLTRSNRLCSPSILLFS